MRREELLSLRLHEAVALKLKAKPELIETIPQKLDRLSDLGQLHPYYKAQWQAWLTLDESSRLEQLLSCEEAWVSLRQASPFAGFLSPKERLVVLKNFKEEWATRCAEVI